MAHDNYAAVIWNWKGSTSTNGPAAYLLRLLSFHTCHHQHSPLHNFIPGHLNQLADKASGWFKQLLTHFNTHYPQPRPWQLSHLRPEMHSVLTSCLCKKRLDPALWLSKPLPLISIGNAGNTSTNFVPYLQVFGQRIRDGRLTTSRKPAQSGSVSDTLQAVSQAYKWMEAPDIHIDSHGNINF